MVYVLSDAEKAEFARVELLKRAATYEAAVAAQATAAREKADAEASYRATLEAKTDAQVQAEYDACRSLIWEKGLP